MSNRQTDEDDKSQSLQRWAIKLLILQSNGSILSFNRLTRVIMTIMATDHNHYISDHIRDNSLDLLESICSLLQANLSLYVDSADGQFVAQHLIDNRLP